MSNRLPSLESMEILAVSDPEAFGSLMEHIGLPIVGIAEDDPLETRISESTVAAIATEITEDVNEYVDIDPRLFGYKEMAEDYGYVVSLDPITEKKWIQKAIKKSHEGYCTPMSKSTCTPRRKALAKRFKKGGDMYSGDED